MNLRGGSEACSVKLRTLGKLELFVIFFKSCKGTVVTKHCETKHICTSASSPAKHAAYTNIIQR